MDGIWRAVYMRRMRTHNTIREDCTPYTAPSTTAGRLVGETAASGWWVRTRSWACSRRVGWQYGGVGGVMCGRLDGAGCDVEGTHHSGRVLAMRRGGVSATKQVVAAHFVATASTVVNHICQHAASVRRTALDRGLACGKQMSKTNRGEREREREERLDVALVGWLATSERQATSEQCHACVGCPVSDMS